MFRGSKEKAAGAGPSLPVLAYDSVYYQGWIEYKNLQQRIVNCDNVRGSNEFLSCDLSRDPRTTILIGDHLSDYSLIPYLDKAEVDGFLAKKLPSSIPGAVCVTFVEYLAHNTRNPSISGHVNLPSLVACVDIQSFNYWPECALMLGQGGGPTRFCNRPMEVEHFLTFVEALISVTPLYGVRFRIDSVMFDKVLNYLLGLSYINSRWYVDGEESKNCRWEPKLIEATDVFAGVDLAFLDDYPVNLSFLKSIVCYDGERVVGTKMGFEVLAHHDDLYDGTVCETLMFDLTRDRIYYKMSFYRDMQFALGVDLPVQKKFNSGRIKRGGYPLGLPAVFENIDLSCRGDTRFNDNSTTFTASCYDRKGDHDVSRVIVDFIFGLLDLYSPGSNYEDLLEVCADYGDLTPELVSKCLRYHYHVSDKLAGDRQPGSTEVDYALVPKFFRLCDVHAEEQRMVVKANVSGALETGFKFYDMVFCDYDGSNVVNFLEDPTELVGIEGVPPLVNALLCSHWVVAPGGTLVFRMPGDPLVYGSFGEHLDEVSTNYSKVVFTKPPGMLNERCFYILFMGRRPYGDVGIDHSLTVMASLYAKRVRMGMKHIDNLMAVGYSSQLRNIRYFTDGVGSISFGRACTVAFSSKEVMDYHPGNNKMSWYYRDAIRKLGNNECKLCSKSKRRECLVYVDKGYINGGYLMNDLLDMGVPESRFEPRGKTFSNDCNQIRLSDRDFKTKMRNAKRPRIVQDLSMVMNVFCGIGCGEKGMYYTLRGSFYDFGVVPIHYQNVNVPHLAGDPCVYRTSG